MYWWFECVSQKFHLNGWFFAVFKKSSSTIQTDLETDSPPQTVLLQDKCYETMQGVTQSHRCLGRFLNQANTTLLRIKLRKTVNNMICLIREKGDKQT